MGLHKPSATGGVFLRILDGSLVRKSDTERPGYELYETKNPQTDAPVKYWIERFGSIDGYLVGLERVEKADKHIFGWKLRLVDDVEMVIDLKDDAPTTKRVLKMLPNVRPDSKLTISVFRDDKGYSAIAFKQDDQNVPQFWNRDNLPEPVQKRGKWDYSPIDDFLYDETMKLVEQINAGGEERLNAYRDQVTAQVKNGTYEHPYGEESFPATTGGDEEETASDSRTKAVSTLAASAPQGRSVGSPDGPDDWATEPLDEIPF